MKKPLLILFLSIFFTFFLGCAVAPFIVSPIVTGVIVWKEGEARKYYNDNVNIIYRSVKNSLEDLELPIIEDKFLEKNKFYVVAGDKNKFKITIREVKPKITEVKVRVDFMGDKPYAELLYSQIDLNTNTIEYDHEGKPVRRKNFRIFDR